MKGARIIALLVAVVVAFGIATPGAGAASAKPTTAATATAKKKKRKAAPTRCRAGSLLVKTGRTRRCVRRRLTPPAIRDVDRGQLALNLALGPNWPAMRDRRGRKVVPFPQRLKRVRGGTAALRRTFARGLAAANAGGATAPLASPVRAFAGARGHPTARAAGGSVSGMSDGSSIGFRGEIPAGEYRIFVSYSTNDLGQEVESHHCPTGAGVIDGTKSVRHSLEIRITRDNQLVSGMSTTWSDIAKFKGQTADDAKFETLDVDHEGLVITTIRGADHAPIGVRVRTRRTATANMRSGSYTLNTPPPQVEASITGALASLAHELEAQLARRLADDADTGFGRFVSQGMSSYYGKERYFNQDNTCVTMQFDPAADPVRHVLDERGTFTSWVEADRDRGTRLMGIWKQVDASKVEFTPAEAQDVTPRWEWKVTDDSQPDIPGRAGIRVTSKAGVGFKRQDIPLKAGPAYFRVTDFVYTDQLLLDNAFGYAGCTPSSTQHNALVYEPSGLPFDGAIGTTLDPNQLLGSLIAKGKVTKAAVFNGCKWNDDASARVPCTVSSSDNQEVFAAALQIEMPAADGPARITWYPRGPSVGDVPPVISACEPAVGIIGGGTPQVFSVARSKFEDPGTQTITMDVPLTETMPGGYNTIHSIAHYAITYERVNEDGSRYSG